MTSGIPVPAAAESEESTSEITKRPPGARPTGLPGDLTALLADYAAELDEQVWVFTYPDVADRDNRIAHPLTPPQDNEYVIKGPGSSLVIVDRHPDDTGLALQQIADRVHGEIVQP